MSLSCDAGKTFQGCLSSSGFAGGCSGVGHKSENMVSRTVDAEETNPESQRLNMVNAYFPHARLMGALLDRHLF